MPEMVAVRLKPGSGNAAVGLAEGRVPPTREVIFVPGAPVAFTVMMRFGGETVLLAGNGPGSDIVTSVAVVVIVMPPGMALGGDVGVALYDPGLSPSALRIWNPPARRVLFRMFLRLTTVWPPKSEGTVVSLPAEKIWNVAPCSMYFGAVTVPPTTWSASTQPTMGACARQRNLVSVLAVMGGSRSAAAAGVAARNARSPRSTRWPSWSTRSATCVYASWNPPTWAVVGGPAFDDAETAVETTAGSAVENLTNFGHLMEVHPT